MESSAIARYNPQKSNKRVFPGSSSSHMEPDVIEIAPLSAGRTSKSNSKSLKQKEVVYHEIIDVDMDEDRNDVVFIEGKIVDSNKKRKGAMGISLGPNNAEQGSMDRGQTTKKVDSNNKGKGISMTQGGVQMNSVGPDHSSKSYVSEFGNFLDLDDYVFEDDYLALQSHFDLMDIPTGIEAQIPWLPDKAQMKKNAALHSSSTYSGLHTNNSSKNLPFVETPQKLQHQNMPFNYIHGQVAPPPMKLPNPVSYFSHSSNTPQVGGGMSSSFYQGPLNTAYPLGVDPSFSMFPMGDMLMDQVVAGNGPRSSSVVGSSSKMAKAVDNEDVLKRYESFKKFDTVVDFSDHHYKTMSSGMRQPPKNWAKKVQDEWRILEKDLPDTIFVRAYESRMDLLRAVIIGAEGTPYHDGLFFFDVCFTSSYPSSPPLVHYHSGGLRINPNLYNSGKVCLSLLNTWTGGQKERWVPGTSTMLQVLVSIQGLILNTKPYFNEPGYANSSGSARGEKASIQYNENTLILSLKTMVYTMKNPPKHFEDLVRGHFRNRVRDILMACKAYTEGVQVGCLVRGGVQDLDEGSGDSSCSTRFKGDVAACVKTLVGAFKTIGAKEAEEFKWLSEKKFHSSQQQQHSQQHGRTSHSHVYPSLPLPLPPPPPPFGSAISPYPHFW